MSTNTLERFSRRVVDEWLTTYCKDRGYSVSDFKPESIRVGEADAEDCMLAIDEGVVVDLGGGRYRAARNSANEVLFWDGTRRISPRSTWLWLETVIIFAGVGRLHRKYRWPRSLLATQPKGWAFDIAAYPGDTEQVPDILAEVKKSTPELDRLRRDLESLSAGATADSVRPNSLKKWKALIAMKPSVLWLLGPGDVQHCYQLEYKGEGAVLHQVTTAALECRVA